MRLEAGSWRPAMNTFFGARSSSALVVGPTLNPPCRATSCTRIPEPLELCDRRGQQRVLARIADLGRCGRQDQPARTALGVFGHRNCDTNPNSVRYSDI